MKNHMDTVNLALRNYSYVFNFEDEFVHQETRKWMINNWTNGFYFCGLYMIFIFAGRHYMQNRPAYELRGVLSLWNTGLALFSILGASRTAPELFHVLKNYGVYHSVCVPRFLPVCSNGFDANINDCIGTSGSFIETDRVAGFWTWMFVLSKLPELGDTVFIVLRKQPLIFLHWYHHITVLMYCWFSYTEYTSSARWFVVMNYCVHSIMYTYYALKAMRYSPPRKIAMVITVCQLTQMVIGCTINFWVLQILTENKRDCKVSWTNIKLSLAMYFSYFVLFARFFYKAYFSAAGRKKFSANGIANGVDKSSSLSNGVNGKIKSH